MNVAHPNTNKPSPVLDTFPLIERLPVEIVLEILKCFVREEEVIDTWSRTDQTTPSLEADQFWSLLTRYPLQQADLDNGSIIAQTVIDTFLKDNVFRGSREYSGTLVYPLEALVEHDVHLCARIRSLSFSHLDPRKSSCWPDHFLPNVIAHIAGNSPPMLSDVWLSLYLCENIRNIALPFQCIEFISDFMRYCDPSEPEEEWRLRSVLLGLHKLERVDIEFTKVITKFPFLSAAERRALFEQQMPELRIGHDRFKTWFPDGVEFCYYYLGKRFDLRDGPV